VKRSLRRSVSLAVLTRASSAADHHEDLGCSILGPASRPVRRAQRALKRRIVELGPEGAAREAKALIAWLEETPAYRALCDGERRRLGRRVLKDQVLYPDLSKTPPRVLHLRCDELGLDVPVRANQWPLMHELFATLAAGATRGELAAFRRVALTNQLLDDLTQAGWLERSEPADVSHDGVFVGHNTTLIRGHQASVLVDPYLRPASRFDLPSFQPMQPRDLGRVDAVLITHSHGDHLHLGSLLQLPLDVRVFVPPVERESLFSTDCAARLRQLGFTNVEALSWGAARTVGDVTITALPFYGEQPTDQRGVHGLFNLGSTWLVESPRVRATFFADSGHDVRGDMRQVCAQVKGRADVLFCGVRGFKLKPIFFGFTTLDAFLVDVPRALLDVPQQLMADADTALEYARLLGTSALVPCADGGAPWYWREGMGPKYPGFPGVPVDGASTWDENPDADPFPERVVARGRQLNQRVDLLRPGVHFDFRRGHLVPTSVAPFVWPFSA
jgi:L-ascorbate metabolism protein UlaG (beta-lactamase superfamily)